MVNKSKGMVEAELSRALTQWEKDFFGRGSVSVKTDILRDMIIVNLRGVLTHAEYLLCETKEGMLSVKRLRADLIETGIADVKEIIGTITGEKVKSFHTDLSTQSGERVMVIKLENDYEKKFSN